MSHEYCLRCKDCEEYTEDFNHANEELTYVWQRRYQLKQLIDSLHSLERTDVPSYRLSLFEITSLGYFLLNHLDHDVVLGDCYGKEQSIEIEDCERKGRMGYTTSFYGEFTATPPLTEEHQKELREFAELEHWNKDKIPEKYKSLPPVPGDYCQWIPTEDGSGIEWDDREVL